MVCHPSRLVGPGGAAAFLFVCYYTIAFVFSVWCVLLFLSFGWFLGRIVLVLVSLFLCDCA